MKTACLQTIQLKKTVSNTYLRHRRKHNKTYILLFEIIGPWFESTLIAIINCIFSPFEAFQLKNHFFKKVM